MPELYDAPLPSPGQELPLPPSRAELQAELNASSSPPKDQLPENDKKPAARPGNVPSSAQNADSTSPITRPSPKHIIVLGAGIIGLQTALTILSSEETKHFKVTIIAEHTPSDHDPSYTSSLAGGYWRSHVGMAENTGWTAPAADRRTLKLQKFDLVTYRYWTRLCDSWTKGTIDQAKLDNIACDGWREKVSDDQMRQFYVAREKAEARSGLGWRMARYYWGKETDETAHRNGTRIWWLNRIRGLPLNADIEKLKRRLEERADGGTFELGIGNIRLFTPTLDTWEHWPENAIWAIYYRSVCFEPDKYLKWVMRQVKKKGGKVIKAKVATEGGPEGVVREAKAILLEKLGQRENAEYYEVPEDYISSDDELEKSPSTLKRLSSASVKGIRKVFSLTKLSSRKSSRISESGSMPTSSGTQTTDQISLSEELVGDPEIVAIVNCTGAAARHFVSDLEKNLMYPVRGQTILVKGSSRQCRTYVGYPGALDEEMLYVVPLPGTNTTVLGGCKQVKSWDDELETEIDEELNKWITEGIKRFKLAEDLRTGPEREFEIIDEYEDRSKRFSVGFCPGRRGGPRVELERGNGFRVKVDGTYVLHNYGHADAGYQSSVGCAEKIRKLIMQL